MNLPSTCAPRKYMNTFILSVMLILAAGVNELQAQDKKSQLQQQKAKIEEEISYTNRLLDETKKNKQTSVNQLVLLNKQISKRQELINAISGEIRNLDNQINQTNDTIRHLTKTIERLKKEYASMIYYAHKNRNAYSRLMFIFSARDFNQAYQRLKYFQQYAGYRQNQVRVIRQNQEELNKKLLLLEQQKKSKLEVETDGRRRASEISAGEEPTESGNKKTDSERKRIT